MSAQHLVVATVYKAITRTPNIYGVAYDYFVLEVMVAGLAFIVHLPYVLSIVPLHAVGLVAFKIDPQLFKVLKVKSSLVGEGNRRYWGGKTYDAG